MNMILYLFAVLMICFKSYCGEVAVTWTFASNNVDGTPLTDLSGGKVYYGTSSSNYTHIVDVPGGSPGQTVTFVVTNLQTETKYYLNGTAYNIVGLESDFCREVAKTAVEKVTSTTVCAPLNLRPFK